MSAIPHGIIQGQNTNRIHENFIICSIQTLARRGLPYVDFIYLNAPKFGEARGKRVYLEQFRKSKKAMLILECPNNGVQAKESYAYAHPDYIDLLKALDIATEQEITLQWQIEAAKLRVQIFQTESANNRAVDRSVA